MPRAVSVGAMIEQLSGLLGTADLSDWEQGFVENMVRESGGGMKTSRLSEAQVDKVEQVWRKHFA